MDFHRIGRGIGANVYDKLIIAVVQLSVVPIFAGKWGLELYAIWVLISTAPSFLGVSDFGFATAAGTTMTILVAKEKHDEAIEVFHSAWASILCISSVIIIICILIVWVMPVDWFPQSPKISPTDVRLALSILLVYGIVSLQGSIFMSAFRSTGLYALGMFWSANTILVENTCAIAVVLAGGGPVEAAAALLVARCVALGVQNVLLRLRAPWLKIGLSSAKFRTVRQLLKPAIAVAAVPLAQACFLQGTAVALGMAATIAAVPAFTAARTISRIGLQLPLLVNNAFLPEFSVAVARDDRRAQSTLILLTLISSALMVVPFALIIAVFGKQLVQAWSHGVIQPSQLLMATMAATILLGGFWNPLSNLILAMNKQALFSYPYAVLSVLAVPMCYVLSLWQGSIGAAASIAIVDVVMCGIIFKLCSAYFPKLEEIVRSCFELAKIVRSTVRNVKWKRM